MFLKCYFNIGCYAVLFTEILRQHHLREPYPIVGEEEFTAVGQHLLTVNLYDVWFAVPGADIDGGLFVWRKMNIEPGARQKTFLVDGFKKLRGGSMIEDVRRRGFFEFYIDRDGMTLAGANLSPIKTLGVFY